MEPVAQSPPPVPLPGSHRRAGATLTLTSPPPEPGDGVMPALQPLRRASQDPLANRLTSPALRQEHDSSPPPPAPALVPDTSPHRARTGWVHRRLREGPREAKGGITGQRHCAQLGEGRGTPVPPWQPQPPAQHAASVTIALARAPLPTWEALPLLALLAPQSWRTSSEKLLLTPEAGAVRSPLWPRTFVTLLGKNQVWLRFITQHLAHSQAHTRYLICVPFSLAPLFPPSRVFERAEQALLRLREAN